MPRKPTKMWFCLGLLLFNTTYRTATAQAGDARYEWGWRLETPPSGGGQPVTAGQYYVRLPETSGAGAEQRVRYQADESGYHGALAVSTRGQHHTHAHTFALGEQALTLLRNQNQDVPQIHQNIVHVANRTTHPTGSVLQGNNEPTQLEIYLLQQQFTSPSNSQQNTVQILQNAVTNDATQYNALPTYYTNGFTTPTQYHINHQKEQIKYSNNENSSTPLVKVVNFEQKNEEDFNKKGEPFSTQLVQVFKDHNCTDEGKSEHEVSNQKTTKLFAEVPSFDQRNIHNGYNGNFGAKVSTSYSVQKDSGAKTNERQNSRSERVFLLAMPTNSLQTSSIVDNENLTHEGISKLVASTQDLISNEDLLTINHAVEKQNYVHNDDNILRPKTIAYPQPEQSRRHDNFARANHARSRFTLKAKLGSIIDSEVDHTDRNSEQILQTSANEYKFANPIVVQDSTINDYKTQVMNNLVSTIVPYLEKGYELKSVKNTFEENPNFGNRLQDLNDSSINMTPRPISQKYLAAITVGLRLLNSNATDFLNSVDDYEGSDSEVVSDTVKSPERERTTVEIQESLPIEITHINDVVVHEWDQNRSQNEPFAITKSLYDQYNDALESSRKIQEHMNKNLYLYGTMKDYHDEENTQNTFDKDVKDTNDGQESGENVQTEIQAESSNINHDRKEFISAYNNNFGEKLIQPIIIEKEIPVTKYVDRFIEKKVPYPEPVEVIKEVPIERHVHIPVPVEKIVDRPVEVTKYVDRPQPYAVRVPHPVPYEVKVPYPVQNNVYIDRPVHIPIPVDRVIEKQVVQQVAVPTPVAVPVEVQVPVQQKVLYPVTVEKQVAVPVEVEKRVPYETIVEKQVPVPYPVEKKVPYPVPYETRVPVPYPVEKRVPVPVHIQVPVPHPVAVPVHVHHPYPVDRIVEKKVPYPVHVEKIVEKPIVVTRYVDKPYPVEKRVPYPVEKIVEKRVPYPVQVPFEVKVPYPVEKIVDRPVPYPAEKMMEKPYKAPYPFDKPAQYYHPQLLQHSYPPQQQKLPAQAANQQYLYPIYQQHPSNQIVPQYLQFNKVINEKSSKKSNSPVQTTAWGNLYASTYQYINNTPEHHKINFKKTPILDKYIGYLTNTANSNQYYGPPPIETASYWNQNVPKNNNYMVEFKLRRTDRTPKVANLRIEYGGFKPPLVPSTEVDLDGLPVNHEQQS